MGAALVTQNPPADAGDIRDLGLALGLGRPPGGGHGNPLQHSCLEEPGGYSPWGRKDPDVTEQLSTSFTDQCSCHFLREAFPDLLTWVRSPFRLSHQLL